jgi:hypothetical protein
VASSCTHLFIVCPNNSGSTLLVELLGTSAQASIFPSLNHEGQWVAKAAGDDVMPYPEGQERRNWTVNAEKFANPENYDWPRLKQAWLDAWSPAKVVRIEKSPSLVVSAPLFQSRFDNARFILCMRDPYAVCEGVRRREGYGLETAATHWLRCAELQLRNRRVLAPHLFITYEELCREPSQVAGRIAELVPELEDVDVTRVFDVMSCRSEIRDQNRAQISRLTPDDIRVINRVLARRLSTLEVLGYDLLDEREYEACR